MLSFLTLGHIYQAFCCSSSGHKYTYTHVPQTNNENNLYWPTWSWGGRQSWSPKLLLPALGISSRKCGDSTRGNYVAHPSPRLVPEKIRSLWLIMCECYSPTKDVILLSDRWCYSSDGLHFHLRSYYTSSWIFNWSYLAFKNGAVWNDNNVLHSY